MSHQTLRTVGIRFLHRGGPADTAFGDATRVIELTDSELAIAHGGQSGSGPSVQVLPYAGSAVFQTLTITLCPNCPPATFPCEQCPGDFGDIWGGQSEAHQIIQIWTEITGWAVNIALGYVVPAILKAIQRQNAQNYYEQFNQNLQTAEEIEEVSEEIEEIVGDIEEVAILVPK